MITMSNVFIRAEVLGENAAGQKHIHLLASNTDGIHFWTDDKSIIRSIEPQPELYGFTLEYLILFALTCRKAGIENRDLKNFVMNTKLIYEVVRKDYEAQMKEAIAKIFKEDR